MLPTDEKHENMMREITRSRECSVEKVLKYIIECEYSEEFGEKMDKNITKKVQTNYSNLTQLDNGITALTNWIKYIEVSGISKADKHLIKDLRRHKNRLEILRKETI
jgi:hypothetical protein